MWKHIFPETANCGAMNEGSAACDDNVTREKTRDSRVCFQLQFGSGSDSGYRWRWRTGTIVAIVYALIYYTYGMTNVTMWRVFVFYHSCECQIYHYYTRRQSSAIIITSCSDQLYVWFSYASFVKPFNKTCQCDSVLNIWGFIWKMQQSSGA